MGFRKKNVQLVIITKLTKKKFTLFCFVFLVELMLMGFISLLLAVFQGYISEICISTSVADTWHPCDPNSEAKKYKSKYEDKCAKKARWWMHILLFWIEFIQETGKLIVWQLSIFQGKVAFISTSGLHQLHIFIFVLAACHIIYCIATYAFGKIKVRKIKKIKNPSLRLFQSFFCPFPLSLINVKR